MEYSLLACTSKGAHLPKCGCQGIAVMPWSPAQNGRLTGKHRRGQRTPDRLAYAEGLRDNEQPIIFELIGVAKELDEPPAVVAIGLVGRERTRPEVRELVPR
jgi:aryl-alcohol dehydrogenase-like predicted oxidoreductase